MSGLLGFTFAAALGLVLLPRALRGESAPLRRLAHLSLAAHLVSIALQIWITEDVYEGGDMLGYHFGGIQIARLLEYDFQTFAPEVLNVILQRPANIPLFLGTTGTPTGTMTGLAGVLVYLLGESLYGVCAIVAVVSVLGKLALYRAIADETPSELRKPLFVGVMLLPSVVFWSSALLKEAVVIGPLGFMVAAFRTSVVERTVRGLPALGAAATLVALVKPYVLFSFVAAAGAFLYGELARRHGRAATIRPIPLAFAAALAFGAVFGLGELFPEFALDQVAETVSREQALASRGRGGSTYTIGDPVARSITGQLAFAPIAIVSSLFRPFVFEARNAQSLVSALEMTVVLLLAVRAIGRRSLRVMWQDVLRSPMLMFCIVFTLTFALPVGLATTNLGTLTRYRMPLLPFFGAALMIWNTDLFRRGGERWHARS